MGEQIKQQRKAMSFRERPVLGFGKNVAEPSYSDDEN